MRQYRYFTASIVFAVLALLAAALYFGPGDEYLAERAVRAAVRDVGAQLQHVSLTADTEQVKGEIREAYAPYVTAALLEAWLDDPSTAPGRETSSPWPDSLYIRHVTPQGEGYIVEANIVLMTSVEEASPEEDDAGIQPVVMQLIKEEGEWRIAAFQIQAHQEG
jgi:hypothetical protein